MNTGILRGYDSYIIFGTLAMGQQALKQLNAENIDIKYFCDNNPKTWNTEVRGIPVVEPSTLPLLVKDHNALVIIASTGNKHVIATQMQEANVPYVYFSKQIFVEITSFCNQKCTFCPYEYLERKKGHLDWEHAKSFLHDLVSDKSDVLYPVIYPHVMGEPLISRYFFDFLDLCGELGLFVVVVTNFALMDEKIQERLLSNYDNIDIILSLQGPTEKVFHWRKEPKLTYKEWTDRMFQVIESKFKYGFKGQIQISTLWPEIVNNYLYRSDNPLNIFEWFSSKEEFQEWKREFGLRCVNLAEEVSRKYPENYNRLSSEDPNQRIEHFYHKHSLKRDLDEWINAEGPAQFEFLPNVHIYGKAFGVWGVEKYFKALLPDDKFLYWEENWHTLPEKCNRLGDVALLSSGEMVVCNVDNEADYVIADLNKGEKYTNTSTQQRLRDLRENPNLSPLCRRCKARALVFDTLPLENAESQKVVHYGMRWHRKATNANQEVYRKSYEYSCAFVLPRINATSLEVDVESTQSRKQYNLIKILSYDDVQKIFTERCFYTQPLKPGERKKVSIPYSFEMGKLHRIDFIVDTQDSGGVMVYGISLQRGGILS